MKKLIIGISVGVSLAFAIALANTEETSEEPSLNTISQNQICIDDQGSTHRRGERGFQSCLDSYAALHSQSHAMDADADSDTAPEQVDHDTGAPDASIAGYAPDDASALSPEAG